MTFSEDQIGPEPSRRPVAVTAASALLFLCTVLVLFVNVFVAIVFAVLGVLVARGMNLARITTWAVVGLGVLCLGGGQITRGIMGWVDGPRTESAVPPWKWDIGTAIDIVTLLALVLVAILLALPSAHPFFRRPEDSWVPPTK
jgi:hypothetical protein